MTKTNSNSKNRHKSRHSNNGHKNNGMPVSKNTIFDSNGPCGKLRGNVSQVIEKYQVAAKDASMQGESVLAELCMQYADHYGRISASFVDDTPKKQHSQKEEKSEQIKEEVSELVMDNLDLSIPDFSLLEKKEEKLAIENV